MSSFYRFLGMFLLLWVGLSANGLLAQSTEHGALLEGTHAYEQGNYDRAINHFGAAIEHNDRSLQGHYNLGNALYKTKRYEEAASQFQQAEEQAQTPEDKARAWYNLGNSRLAQAQQGQQSAQSDKGKHLKAAIDAYKQALRLHPRDYEAKNNLAAAYKLLRQQEPPQQQQEQNNQQNNQEDQDQKDNEDQQDSDNPSENQDNKDGQDEQPPQNQDQPQDNPSDSNEEPSSTEPREMTDAEAKRLLEMAEQNDKQVQRRLLEQRRSPPRKIDKKW